MDGCRAGSRTCHDIEVNSKRAFDSSSGTQVDPKQNFEGLDGIIALSTVLVPSLPSKLETYGSKPNTLEIWNQPWIAKSVHAVHCTSLPYILKLGPKPQTIASDCETQESQRKNLGNFHQVSTRRPTINNHKQRPTEPPKVKPPPPPPTPTPPRKRPSVQHWQIVQQASSRGTDTNFTFSACLAMAWAFGAQNSEGEENALLQSSGFRIWVSGCNDLGFGCLQ